MYKTVVCGVFSFVLCQCSGFTVGYCYPNSMSHGRTFEADALCVQVAAGAKPATVLFEHLRGTGNGEQLLIRGLNESKGCFPIAVVKAIECVPTQHRCALRARNEHRCDSFTFAEHRSSQVPFYVQC